MVDIDGDGDLDAFVGSGGGNTLFFQNTGTASAAAFSAPSTNPFGLTSVGVAASPTFVDIDGDGDLDAFVGNFYGDTLFFKNTGTAYSAAFGAAITNAFGLTNVSKKAIPSFVDIDRDGDLDAFIGNYDGNTLFYRNTGTASSAAFAAPSTNPFDLTDVGKKATPTFADIDGDGDLDVFVGSYGGNTLFYNTVKATDTDTVVLNKPPTADVTVTLASNQQVTYDVSFLTFTTANWNVPQTVTVTAINDIVGEGSHTGVIWHTVTSADTRYNGSAVDNVAVAIIDNDLPLAGPVFNSPTTNDVGISDVGSNAHLSLADIDADGDLDAFVSNSAGDTLFFQNDGTVNSALFAAPSTNAFGLANVGTFASSTLVDIDGDGDLDAFVGNRDGNLLFFENTGAVTSAAFAAASTNPFGLSDVGYYASPTFADIDGDGDLDGFIGNNSGDTLFFKNTGTARAAVFSAPSTNPFGLTSVSLYASPTLVDLDGDGDLDAVIGNYDGNTLFFKNTGTAYSAAFGAAITNAFGLTDVGAFASPTFADIDGNGDLNALIGNADGNILFYVNIPNIAPTATNLNQTVAYTENTTAAIGNIVITDPDASNTFTATVTLASGNSAIGLLTASSGNGETYNSSTGVGR